MNESFDRDRRKRFQNERGVDFRAPVQCAYNYVFEQFFKQFRRMLAIAMPDHAEAVKGEEWEPMLCAKSPACGMWNADAPQPTCLEHSLGMVCAMGGLFFKARNSGLFDEYHEAIEAASGRKIQKLRERRRKERS